MSSSRPGIPVPVQALIRGACGVDFTGADCLISAAGPAVLVLELLIALVLVVVIAGGGAGACAGLAGGGGVGAATESGLVSMGLLQ